MTSRPRFGRTSLAAVSILAISTLTTIASPATAEPETTTAGAALSDIRTFGDPVAGLTDLDVRKALAPLPAQVTAAKALAADIRWNSSGTPSSILPDDGSLGSITGPVAAGARSWLRANADVLGISAASVDALELVNVQEMADSDGVAVLFRQRFGDLSAAAGGLVTVGVADGRIAFVSSSLTRTPAAASAPSPALGAVQAWLKAAADVGEAGGLASKIVTSTSRGWTRLKVPGFGQEQQVRLRALALSDGTVRPVYEANVVQVAGGAAKAYTVFVDAVDGTVLVRRNQQDHAEVQESFTGSFAPGSTDCGTKHEFALNDDATKQMLAVAVGAPTDDFVVKLWRGDQVLTSGDTATNPEVATYASDNIPAGTYSVQVCPFDTSSLLGQYAVTVRTSDTAAPSAGGLPVAKWRWFLANPTLDSPTQVPGNSAVGCWTLGSPDCTVPPGALANPASVGAWDTLGGKATFTTVGNNANTHEAWASPLTPGGLFQAPYSPTRDYTQQFTDAWNNSQCNPAQLVPGGNDINASVTNLFAAHNRMHDYSYYLGFTEANYNMQVDNFDRGGLGGDPEVGNAQAGAIGGLQSGLGRDNANQITLQDGTPGVTNQYLFQPIAGAFYAPCTDGGLDMGIVGHEYTHAITNRMVGGPDEGLTSEQGGAMGESWGDLVAGEFQFSHGYDNGGNIWAVGAYATGNLKTAIRDYAINRNPLNFSNYGFDSTGPEVHSDGEIWNGTMWEVRQALVEKYDAQFPYADKSLQLACAQATPGTTPRDVATCPGNRRWIQLMFDSYLLQQGATSMIDARNALIAADEMRFGGANKAAISDAFARRGMGAGASTPDADAHEVTPSFASTASPNQQVTFSAPAGTQVYVGDFEARVTPVADTVAQTQLSPTAAFTAGRYRMVAVSPDRGFTRFDLDVPATGGSRTVTVPDNGINVASAAAGATVIGATEGSRNAGQLIDGTETTNWGGVVAESVDLTSPSVTVDLAGDTHVVRRVAVSAMLNPAPAEADPVPLLAEVDEDPDSGSRFTALRRFALEACTADCASSNASWTRFYTSPADAFPAERPRPVAPDLSLRSFDVPDTSAAAVRLVALENQCTGFDGYAGDQDLDPTNDTDCKTGSDRDSIVHASELQVFGTELPPGGQSGPSTGAGTGNGTGTVSGTTSGTGSGTATGSAMRTRVRMIVKRAFQTQQKPAPVLFLAIRSVVEKEAGKLVVRINKRKYRVVRTTDGTARIKVRKSRLHPGRNTVRVRFVPTDATAFTSSKTRLRRITVEKSG
jgi:extracellular elastinolytic metalloproteinase